MKIPMLALFLLPAALIAIEPSAPAEAKFDPGPLGAGIESGRKHTFNLAPSLLNSDDLSDWTPALQFDFSYLFAEAGNWPSEAFDLRFAANGTIAWDEDLNRDPLRARIDYYYMAMPGFEQEAGDWDKPLVAGEAPRSNPFSFELGLSAAYETDQSFDHRNGVASAFVKFIQPRGNDWHGLLPSIIVAFDGVFPDTNETADAVNADLDAHVRLRAVADWEVRASILTKNELLRPLTFHAAAEYSKEFGPPSSWEIAGEDESFGVFAELSYALRTGIDATGSNHQSPFAVFARATTGRIAPEPENDTTLLFGTRFGF